MSSGQPFAQWLSDVRGSAPASGGDARVRELGEPANGLREINLNGGGGGGDDDDRAELSVAKRGGK